MRRGWLLCVAFAACDPDAEMTERRQDAGADAGTGGGAARDAGAVTDDAGEPPDPSLIVRSISPSAAATGDEVQVRVEGLVGVPTVTFGAAVASDVRVSQGLVTCRVPAGDGLVDVSVRDGTRVSSLPRAFVFAATSSRPPDAGIADGSIADAGVTPVDAGSARDAGSSGPREPSFTLEAEAATQTQGVQAVNDAIGFVDDGDWLAFDSVNCGLGVDMLEVHLATPNSGGQLELRLDSATGTLLGTLAVTSTGGWDTRAGQRFTLSRTTGVRRFVLVAKGRADVANLDRLVFNP